MSQDHGKVLWNELMTRDVEGAKEYYGATFGWTFETMPVPGGEGDYTVAKLGDEMVAGMMDMSDMELEGVPAHWFTYFAVDDVDAAAGAAEAAGAKVHRQPFDVGTVGRIAIVEDPTGAMMGLMTPFQD